jgi:hypothetical protein
LTPVDPAVSLILQLVAVALNDLVQATVASRQPLLSATTSVVPDAFLPKLC